MDDEGGRVNRGDVTMTLEERGCSDERKNMSSENYNARETEESPVGQDLEFLVLWAAQVSGVIV